VRELRLVHDLAQGQLAEALGVSRQTINSIENERNPYIWLLAIGGLSCLLAVALLRWRG
jgi:DNA-binding XRE family transcriptional regulator